MTTKIICAELLSAALTIEISAQRLTHQSATGISNAMRWTVISDLQHAAFKLHALRAELQPNSPRIAIEGRSERAEHLVGRSVIRSLGFRNTTPTR